MLDEKKQKNASEELSDIEKKYKSKTELFKLIGELLLAIISVVTLLSGDLFGGNIPTWVKVIGLIGGFAIVLMLFYYGFSILNYKHEFTVFGRKSIRRKIRRHVRHLRWLTRRTKRDYKKMIKKTKSYDEGFCGAILKRYQEADTLPEKSAKSTRGYYLKIKLQQKKNSYTQKLKNATDAIDEVTKTILQLDHVLLSANHLRNRIFLGKFLKDYANDDNVRLQAKVDMLGWTYALLGKRNQCKKIIEEALNDISEVENSKAYLKYTEDEKVKFMITKIRCYRHLVANPQIRRHEFNNCKNHIKMAFTLLDELAPSLKSDQDKLFKNYVALCFGEAELYYDEAKVNYKRGRINEANLLLKDAINDIRKAIGFKDAEKAKKLEELRRVDNHRYANVLLLSNKLAIFGFKLLQAGLEDEELSTFVNQYFPIDGNEHTQLDTNLKSMEKVFNKSIYVDQAIESFIQESVLEAYKNVGTIYNIRYGKNIRR